MIQAAVRETREETGIDCEVTGLVGIYTDPRHVMLYTSNGEVRQEFSIVLTARATGGEPTRSEEGSEVRWVPRAELGGYPMDRSMRLRIGHYLEDGLRRTSVYRSFGALPDLLAAAAAVRLRGLAGLATESSLAGLDHCAGAGADPELGQHRRDAVADSLEG